MSMILCQLPGAERIVVGACDGTKQILNGGDVFAGGIYARLLSGLSQEAMPTLDKSVSVSQMVEDATFQVMFGSLATSYLPSDAQATKFIEEQKEWLLTNGWSTFIPFQKARAAFVAHAFMSSDSKPAVRVYELDFVSLWLAVRRHCVVLPADPH